LLFYFILGVQDYFSQDMLGHRNRKIAARLHFLYLSENVLRCYSNEHPSKHVDPEGRRFHEWQNSSQELLKLENTANPQLSILAVIHSGEGQVEVRSLAQEEKAKRTELEKVPMQVELEYLEKCWTKKSHSYITEPKDEEITEKIS
jgi:hypothetical protein